MATATTTYTFTNGIAADAVQVNTNFTDIKNFLNTEVVQRDASIPFTVIPSGPASDPTTANQFTRKSYVDASDLVLTRKVPTWVAAQVGSAGTFSSGQTLITSTITDPGYDIEILGSATCHFVASVQPSIWDLTVYVDGVQISGLTVPFISVVAPYGISIGVPLARATHATGTNCAVTVKMNNIYGGGTITLGNPAGSFAMYNQLQYQWRKNG